MKFKRILLKLSGEALIGSKNGNFDPAVLEQYCEEIKLVKEQGVELAIVIGGGNIFRGGQAETLGDVEIEFANLRAEVAAFDGAGGAQGGDDIFREVAGDREADALEAAALGFDRGADADDFAVQIHERAAAVAGIDGGVGL